MTPLGWIFIVLFFSIILKAVWSYPIKKFLIFITTKFFNHDNR